MSNISIDQTTRLRVNSINYSKGKITRFIVSVLMSYNDMKCKEKQIRNRFLKLTISLFLLFFCLTLSLPWKYLPNSGCKYSSLLNVFLKDFFFTTCKDEPL